MNISDTNYKNIHILVDIPFISITILVFIGLCKFFPRVNKYDRIKLKNVLLKDYTKLCT